MGCQTNGEPAYLAHHRTASRARLSRPTGIYGVSCQVRRQAGHGAAHSLVKTRARSFQIYWKAIGSPLDQVDPPPADRNHYRHPPRSGQGGVGLGQVGGCGSRGHLGFFKFAPPAPPIAKSNRGYFDVGASSQGRSTPISPGFRPSRFPPGREL